MKKLTNKKRMILAGLLCGGMLASASVGGALCVQAAEAAPSFAIVEAASIRSNAPAGIRFATQILITEYEELEQKNAIYGTVVYPQHLLGEAELTVETAGAVNVAATKWTALTDDEKTAIDESLYYQYNAVLVGEYDEATDTYAGLPEQMYGVKLVARSYVTYDGENGDKVTEYVENTSIRSIADVAKGALLDTTRTYSTDEIAYFHDITDYVADTVSAVSVNTVEETIEATVPVSAEYGAVLAVYEQASDAKITDWSYADNALTFDADFLKSLPYGEYNLKVLTENGVFVLPTTIYGASTLGYDRLLGFDSSLDTAKVKNVKADTTVEWLADYQGAKGVMKINNSGYSTGYSFVADYSVAQLKEMEWDFIEYRVYLENVSESVWAYCSWNGDHSLGNLKANAWNVIRIAKADITSLFSDKIDDFYGVLNKAGDGFKTFWGYGTNGANAYFDYIDLKSYEAETYDFADPISKADVLSPANAEWLATFEGANGVIKTTYTGEYSATITVKGNTTVEKLQALDWDVLTVKVWFEETEANKGTTLPDPVKNNWYLNGKGSGARGEWVSLTINKENLATQFTDIDSFYSAFVSNNGALLTEVYNTQNSSIYIDSITFGMYDRVMDFESADEISFLRSGTDAQWLESATCGKGTTENGVISYYHGSTAYAGVKFQFNNYTYMTVNDWDKIEIRIRIIRGSSSSAPGTDASFSTFYIGNTTSSIGSVSNGWSTLTLTKEVIEASDQYTVDSFWSAFTSADGARFFWCYNVYDSADWTIQISSISLVKNA